MNGFAEYPRSVTEIKAGNTQLASDWTPRDCLIATLREIDSGRLAITDLVLVALTVGPPNAEGLMWRQAARDQNIALGILTRAQQSMVRAFDEDN